MRTIILGVLLAVMQATPPVPRQTPNNAARTTTDIKAQSNPSQTPALPSPTTIETSRNRPTENHSDQESQKYTDHSVIISKLPAVTVTTPKRDWADWGSWGFNGLLVAVGGLQIWLLFRTWKTMRRQSDWMKRQTVILVEYNKATREAADAAIKNATTASESVEFLIAKERMRISVEMLPLQLPPPDKVLGHVVDYEIRFYGATLATIVEAYADAEITTTNESPTGCIFWPILIPTLIPAGSPPMPKIAPLYRRLDQSEIDSIKAGKSFMHFRGFIHYNDVFGRARWIRFNQVWRYSEFPLIDGSITGSWWDCGTPEDNSETEQN